jgi:hypothetical protein
MLEVLQKLKISQYKLADELAKRGVYVSQVELEVAYLMFQCC